MNENGSGFWKTLALTTMGLLVGLTGSYGVVQVQLITVKADVTQNKSEMSELRSFAREVPGLRTEIGWIRGDVGKLQGLTEGHAKELETLRIHHAQFDFRLRGVEARKSGEVKTE